MHDWYTVAVKMDGTIIIICHKSCLGYMYVKWSKAITVGAVGTATTTPRICSEEKVHASFELTQSSCPTNSHIDVQYTLTHVVVRFHCWLVLAMSFTSPYVGVPSHISLPQSSFGKRPVVKRSFWAGCFQRWKWLHNSIAQDALHVHCFSCYYPPHVCFLLSYNGFLPKSKLM